MAVSEISGHSVRVFQVRVILLTQMTISLNLVVFLVCLLRVTDDMDKVTRPDVTDKSSITYKKAKSFVENKGPNCEDFLNELDISPAEKSSMETCAREQRQNGSNRR